MTQIFKVPAPGLDPRGVDIDSNGVVWTALAASSHLASFDVRKCTDLERPGKAGRQPVRQRLEALSDHRPEVPGHGHSDRVPLLQLDRPAGCFGLPAEHSDGDRIQLRLDQRPRFPTGSRTVGRSARSLSAGLLRPRSGCSRRQSAIAPAGFAGWKNRAIWSNYGTHFVWHIEGGKGVKGKEVKIPGPPESSGSLVR